MNVANDKAIISYVRSMSSFLKKPSYNNGDMAFSYKIEANEFEYSNRQAGPGYQREQYLPGCSKQHTEGNCMAGQG